jgi:hypothetical protein
MGNKPCCAQEQKDDEPKIEVKVKDIYCCDNIQSSCCIKTKTEKKHHHHTRRLRPPLDGEPMEHKTTHNQSPNQHH